MSALPPTLSQQPSLSSTQSLNPGRSLSCFGRAASLSADAYFASATTVPSRTPSLSRTVTHDGSLSTVGPLTPCGSQPQEGGEDGHWYTYGDDHAPAHMAAMFDDRALDMDMGAGVDTDEVLGTVLQLQASQTSITTECADAEMMDTDVSDSGSDTETETETETAEKTPSNSLRTISRHTTLPGVAFDVPETALYPVHQQRGVPLPRAAWSSTRDYIVVNGGAGAAVSDFLLAGAAAAFRTQVNVDAPGSGPAADPADPAGEDRPDRGDALLSAYFGTDPFLTELHWPNCAATHWLYAAASATTCRRYFYFVATMLKLWLQTRTQNQRADTQDTTIAPEDTRSAALPSFTDVASEPGPTHNGICRFELDSASVEGMHLYGLRRVGMDARGRARWVLDINIV